MKLSAAERRNKCAHKFIFRVLSRQSVNRSLWTLSVSLHRHNPVTAEQKKDWRVGFNLPEAVCHSDGNNVLFFNIHTYLQDEEKPAAAAGNWLQSNIKNALNTWKCVSQDPRGSKTCSLFFTRTNCKQLSRAHTWLFIFWKKSFILAPRIKAFFLVKMSKM